MILRKLSRVRYLGYFINWIRIQLHKEDTEGCIFRKHYKENYWGDEESASGSGSNTTETQVISLELPNVLKELEVQSMLDIPCGDFFWMKDLPLNSLKYTGADIVPELIEENQKKYSNDNIQFQCLDLSKDPLPKSDLIFTRDCLVHLSNEKIKEAIQNIKASGSKYLFTTTFTDIQSNKNIKTGFWRPINLTKAPFNFPEPILLINEKHPRYIGKSMGIWKISDV